MLLLLLKVSGKSAHGAPRGPSLMLLQSCILLLLPIVVLIEHGPLGRLLLLLLLHRSLIFIHRYPLRLFF
jgi:hypothetical protein